MQPCFQAENLERRTLLSSPILAFGAPHTFNAGSNSVVVADVNGDAKPDLIATTGAGVNVLLGNGNGTFQPPKSSPDNGSGGITLVADVNGDGRPDLIIGSRSSPMVLLLGNGDGTFEAPQYIPGGFAQSMAIGDVNGDGKPDIVISLPESTVNVLLGNGDGSFRPAPVDFIPTSRTLFLADVNGDGKPDIITGSQYPYQPGDNIVRVALGNGDGTFRSPQTVTAPTDLRAVADVNGDGKPDLLTLGVIPALGPTVQVQLGNGDGTFQAPRSFDSGPLPSALQEGDFNRDGKVDLLITDRAGMAFLAGNGDGTFRLQQTIAQSGTLADFNGDGVPDLLSIGYGVRTVSLGDEPPTVLSIDRTSPPGPVTSGSSVTYTVTFSEPVTGVDPADFSLFQDGAGAAAPVFVGGAGAVYSVTIEDVAPSGSLGLNLVDDGSIKDAAGNPLQPGGVAAFQSAQTTAVGAVAVAVAAGDLNGDGKPDLVVANFDSNSVSVLLGNGDTTFQGQKTLATGANPGAIALGDINGDGKVDMVVANSGGSSVSVFLGNGDGTFKPAQTLYAGATPISLALADINGEGKLDIAIANAQNLELLWGNGDGTFQASQTVATGGDPVGVAVADVNRDGKPDLIAANSAADGSVSILLGNGNQTFQAPRTFAAGDQLESIAVADLNGDGNLDLVCGGQDGYTVSVLLGNGDGTFAAQQTLAAVAGPRMVTVADVNGDGSPDILVASLLTQSVAVLLGNHDGTFRSPVTFAAVDPESVAVFDVNRDGRPDIIVPDSWAGTVSVLLGNTNANLNGPTYTVVPLLDTITGTAGDDQITLALDPDHVHIDWTLGGFTAQSRYDDVNGLTINGNGGNDTITLDYSNGNPLWGTLHLNGTFTINGLAGTNPLAASFLDVGRSTVFISYGASDPIAAIRTYLRNGYNRGPNSGLIMSAAAWANPNQDTQVGYADSSDGSGVNTTINTIELKYTLIGDANLDGQVNSADLQVLLANLNRSGAWDQGDFNFDGQVNSADLQALLFTLNTSLGSQAAPAGIAVETSSPMSDGSQARLPAMPPGDSTPLSLAKAHPVPKRPVKRHHG